MLCCLTAVPDVSSTRNYCPTTLLISEDQNLQIQVWFNVNIAKREERNQVWKSLVWRTRVTCDVGRPALLSAISTQRRNRRCDQNVVTGQSLSSLLQVCRWFGSNEYKITQHYAECTAETARTAASKCQLIYNNPVLLISYLPLSQCRSLSAAWIPNGHRQTVHPIMNLPARNLLAVLYEPHRPPSNTLHDHDFELSWS